MFGNQYVALIPQLKGIIVKMGSPLSHSAIVAREHEVPYLIDAASDYKMGEMVFINESPL